MATVDDLSVRVSASTGDFTAGMNMAERSLSGLRSDAIQTAGALQILQGRMDETGDEAQTAGMKAGASSGGFLALASSAATTQIAFDSLSVLTTASLIPSLLALSTVLAPLTLALGGFITVAGSIAGVGLIGFLGAATQRSDALQSNFQELKSTVLNQLAPVFDIFAGVLNRLMAHLTDVISEISVSGGVIQRIAGQFEQLGMAVIDMLPAFVNLAVTLTDRFLPPFVEWAERILPKIPGMLQSLIPTMLQVGQALSPLVQSFIRMAPAMNRFGMTVLNVIVPALTRMVNFANRVFVAVNQMEQRFGKLTTRLMILAPVIAGLATTLGGPLLTALTTIGGLLSGTLLTGLLTIATPLASVVSYITSWATIGASLVGMLTGLTVYLGQISAILPSVLGPLSGVVTSMGAFGASLTATLGPIGLLVAAIGTLGITLKNNRQVISRFANQAIRLLQNVVRNAATWIQSNGPALIKQAFRAIGEGIRFIAKDIYNAVTGNGNSILKNIITGFGSWLINKGPGILKSAAKTAFDVIIVAAQGLAQGLVGGGDGVFKQMFGDIASYIKTGATNLITGAIDTLVEGAKSAFNYLTGTGDGTLVGDIKGAAENAIDGLKEKFDVAGAISDALSDAQEKIDKWTPDWPDLSPPSLPGGGGGGDGGDGGGGGGGGGGFDVPFLDSGGYLESDGLYMGHQGERVLNPNETKQLEALRKSDFGGGTQRIELVLEERTDVVESRIKQGAEGVIRKQERRVQRNSGRNPNPR